MLSVNNDLSFIVVNRDFMSTAAKMEPQDYVQSK